MVIKEAALLHKISVVFAPTKNLVAQFHRNYFENDQAFVPVVINSDNPVDETTMKSVKEALETDARVVFLCNYQSLHVVQQLCVDLGVVLDIVMFDEAHNVTSKNSRGKIADMKAEQNSGSDEMDVDEDQDDSECESVNGSEDSASESSVDHVYQVDAGQVAKLQARKTFFFTATPTRVMKNHPDIYGDELIRYTYAQAVMDAVVKNVDTVIECYAADDKSCLDAGYDRLIPAINRFIADADVSRVIVYTSHVRDTLSSKASVDGLVKNKKLFDKNVIVHAVTASTSLQQRDKIFDTFRGKSKKVHVIVSCRTISEGVDLPNCDAVVILDPSHSVVTNVQRGLRACRLTPEERQLGTWDNAVVFYPINVPQQAFVELIDSTQDEITKDYLSKSIHAHSFEFAMTVVNFLKHDLELDVLFDFKCPGSSGDPSARKVCEKKARQRTLSTHGKPVSRVTFSLDTTVTWNIDQFRESATYLSTSMNVIGLDKMWDCKCQLLREFMTVHGRAPSQIAKTKDEKVLGKWVSKHRSDYPIGKLSQDRVTQLESIPGWTWDPVQESYDKNLAAVRDFMTVHGRAPSTHSKTKDEKVLGKWASTRRGDYSKGKLAQERVAQLESIPGWSWDLLQDSFNQNLAAVCEFMTQHGRAPSTTAKTKNEKALGVWTLVRRRDYSKGKLAQERVAQLESIPGWSWDLLQDSFNQNLAAVCEFMTQHGRAPSTTAKTKNEKALGVWTLVRRRDYSKGKLAQDRIVQLESIPGWWWSKETKPKTKSLKRAAPSSVQSDQERTAKRPRQLSTISEYHKRFKSMSSSKLHQEFLSNPQTFHDYHKVASKNWSGFNSQDLPVSQVAAIVNNMYSRTKSAMHIADFGAGLGTLKDLIDPAHDLKGFDHVMSLWGSNWSDYIREAFRVLKFNGYAVIVDSTKRWFLDDKMQLVKTEDSRLIKCLVENGFRLGENLTRVKFHTVCTRRDFGKTFETMLDNFAVKNPFVSVDRKSIKIANIHDLNMYRIACTDGANSWRSTQALGRHLAGDHFPHLAWKSTGPWGDAVDFDDIELLDNAIVCNWVPSGYPKEIFIKGIKRFVERVSA
ncbi:hypothetical protein GGF31_003405 [Allomyces arbusculus]|nr:hypothetical protein GGF31_003405 [Allomyces arbusculus]